MKKGLFLIAVCLSFLSYKSVAQTTIFIESMGVCCGTTNTAITGTTFDNTGLTFTGNTDTRTTTSSTGYTGASGGRNVFVTNTVGQFFQISGINTLSYTSITLSFGHFKSTNASNNELVVEVSSDGTNWTALTYSRPTGSGTANWVLVTPSGVIPSVANLRIRFSQTSTLQLFRIDDIHLQGTAAPTCVTPTQITYSSTAFSALQDAIIPSFDVSLECVSGVATGCNNGTITLTTTGCGISGTLTKSVVNGIATFDDIVFLRSIQSNIAFIATYNGSCSGVLTQTSSTFTVQAPIGGSTTVNIRDQNFTTNPAPWNHTLGTAITVGSGGTAGVDVWSSASGYLAKSYSECNSSGQLGSTNTATFDNVMLNPSNVYTFKFKVASLGDNSCSGGGAGNDNNENLIIETRINGGAWQTLLTHNGSGNRIFPFSALPITSLSPGANSNYISGQDNSAFSVTIPNGSNQFQFRMTATNNRPNEYWAIDDIILEETTFASGPPLELPTLNTNGPINTCPSLPVASAINLTNTVGVISYNWSPSSGVSNTSIANPTFTVGATSSFTLTITDAQNCTASQNLTVNVPSGSAGNWTAFANTDWYNCLNWGNGVVPNLSTNVIIDNSAANICEITNSSPFYNGNARANAVSITNNTLILEDNSSWLETAGSLTLNSGTALLDASAGGTLQIKGDFINNSNAAAFDEANSTVIFDGAVNQNINTNAFNEVFATLVVNKPAGNLVLQDPLEITNQVTFTSGDIVSTGTNLLIFRDNAVHVGTSHNSHTNGPVRKIGNDAFVFPVGNGTFYRNIAISAPGAATDHFTAQFFDISPDAVDGLTVAPIEVPLTNISDCEHWILDRTNGTSSVFVTLSYENYSINNCSGVVDPSSLRVSRWDGTEWKNHGGVGVGAPVGTITTSAAVSAFSPFALATISLNNPLPAELILFDAVPVNKEVAINWATASEINVDYFEVLRSKDGVEFSSLAILNAVGNSAVLNHYKTVDSNPYIGLSFYQLNTVDNDGSSKLSEIKPVYFDGLFDIPTVSNFATNWVINYHPTSNETSMVEIYDASGKLLQTEKIVFSDSYAIIENHKLSKGIYLIRIIDGERSYTLKALR